MGECRILHCFQPQCILGKVEDLVREERIEEADEVLNVAIKYFSDNQKTFQDERKKLLIKRKQEKSLSPPKLGLKNQSHNLMALHSDTLTPADLSRCPFFKFRSNNIDKFKCPVAIFGEDNSKTKLMYPKNLVYANNRDYQLEEIRAARYWSTQQNDILQIVTSAQFGSFLQNQSVRINRIHEVTKRTLGEITNIPAVTLTPVAHSKTNPVSSVLENALPPENKVVNDAIEKQMDGKATLPDFRAMSLTVQSSEAHEVTNNIYNPAPLTNSKLPINLTYSVDSSIKNENSRGKNEFDDKIDNKMASNRTDPNLRVASIITRSPVVNQYECTNTTFSFENNERSCCTKTSDHEEKSVKVNVSFSNNGGAALEEDDNDTFNLNLFTRHLPSSTPRPSLFFNVADNPPWSCTSNSESTSVSVTLNGAGRKYSSIESEQVNPETASKIQESQPVKLSTIVEASGENLLETGSSKKESEPSESDVRESEGYYVEVEDPFDDALIQKILNDQIEFPQKRHLEGYHRVKKNLPPVKQKHSMKIGGKEFKIQEEIGKGNYGKIFKASTTNSPKLLAIKRQKPACQWEYYISEEIRHLLDLDEKNQYFIRYSDFYEYDDGSFLVSELAEYGSILTFINELIKNKLKKCPEAVVLHLSIQFVSALEYLHNCGIIHADVKPDNFVLCAPIAMNKHCVKLIDYGRAINMKLFGGRNVAFKKVVETQDFKCHEMQDNKLWTYQTDLFGLAGTIYLLLMGKYMKTRKQPYGAWCLIDSPNSRFVKERDTWDEMFDSLLNIPSCSELPDLNNIKELLRIYLNSFDSQVVQKQFDSISMFNKKIL